MTLFCTSIWGTGTHTSLKVDVGLANAGTPT